MSTHPTALIQKKIDAIDRRWRWLKFGEKLGMAGTAFALLWFALELCAWRRILVQAWVFYLLAGVFFVVIVAIVMSVQTRRIWLAGRLEKGCPGLLDRLNTLVFLEKAWRTTSPVLKRKIEAQAAQVFDEHPVVNTLSSQLAWRWLGIFTLMLALVTAFDFRYAPFAKLVNAAPASSAAPSDTPFELVPGNTTETRPNEKPWGEVRIVTPGHDVKLTKIDVLPLQIEMTASSTLQSPVWISSINGGPEISHDLPAPTEPQYAVFQPLIYLDELKVSDWDVISYYAKVQTITHAEYASKIYFIEIRPFREDILKETGGSGSQGRNARALLSDLTGLISQQTTVLQQTHLFQQSTYPSDELRKQDNQKLTQAEQDLSAAADHLYGKMIAENENAPIGDILDHLAGAEQQMDKATENLDEEIIPEAKAREQGALTELVACRKSFLKVISQHPDAFGGDGSSPDNGDDPPIATAQDSLKALSQVTEMHDRAESVLKALHQLNMQQYQLALSASNKPDAGGSATGQSENKLKQDLDKLMQDNPDVFRASDTEKAAVESDLAQAIQNLNSADSDESQHYLNHASASLNDLEKAVRKNQQLEQIAEAYKLKKVIDQNIRQLGQEKDKPGSLSPQDIKDIADSAQRSTGTLKEISDSQGGKTFGPGLSQSLSPENQQALQQALAQLGQSSPGPGSQAAAGAAQGNLADVSQAFEKSQPTLTKQIQSQDQLQPPSADAVDQAAQQLQSLILAQKTTQPPPQDQQQKELDEILANLQMGLSKDTTPQAADVLVQVQEIQKLKNGLPVNADELKKLLDEVQTLSGEANDPNKEKPPAPGLTVIDSSKFPANYRDRIRAYYEKLSSQSQ